MRNNTAILAFCAFGALSCIETGLSDDAPQWPSPAPQPLPNIEKTDTIVQVTTPMVDVLWTIDNSCSMLDDQDALIDNFPFFIDYFVGSGLDYHIGVISTDLDNPSQQGKLRTVADAKYIEAQTANPEIVFGAMARMGTSGSGTEKGLGATYKAIEEHGSGYNFGFYRDDAAIHTVIISDEHDQTQPTLVTQPEFSEWYDGLKEDSDDRTFSCIVTMSGPERGTAYLNTSEEIGGITWDIKDTDWSEVLNSLGIQAVGLSREYFLSERPVEGTILVEVEDVTGALLTSEEAVLDVYGSVISGEWIYDSIRNSISFTSFIPNPLSKIRIHYTLLSSEQQVN